MLEWAKEELRKWKELTIDEYAGLYMDNGVVKGSLDGAALEICLLEDFETHEENVVWDIDTDYFLDYQDRAWMNPFVFVDKLSHCCPVPVMVNIAYSVRGGYTIPTQKYLGDMVKMAVEEDIAEDILRDYQKLKICDEKIIREDEEGIEELLKEIEGNGFFRPYVHLRLALLFKSRGDQKKEEFHRSVTAEEKPELLIEDFDWAMNYYRLKDYEKALSIFSNTENIDSGYFIISNLLGALALSEMKMYEKSDEKWLKILSHNCFHSLSDVVKSNILLQVSSNLEAWGKLPRALEILDRAGGIYGENHRIFFQRGNVLRDLGNYEKAARNYRKYLFMRPDNFESLEVQYQLAKIYEIQNKKSLAASEYRKLQARDRTGLYQLRAATGLIRVSRD